jgi:hypothetical protein
VSTPRADWLHATNEPDGSYGMKCLRCGTLQKIVAPVPLTKMVKALKSFERDHADCEPPYHAPSSQETLRR